MITSANGIAHIRTGGYRPVTAEVTVENPRVLGELPRSLNGSLLRIGPNPLHRPDPRRYNVFDGDAMLHGVRLRDGNAEWYRNRWLRTDSAAKALGELPTPGPRRCLSDNANGSIVQHAGRTLALGDGSVQPTRIGPELETVARTDFYGTLPGGLGSHPAVDPLTGELVSVASSPLDPFVTVLTVGTDGRVRRSEQIGVKNVPMMHAFSLTERYAILYDLPVTYSQEPGADGSPVPFGWDDTHGARLGLLPREGGDADVLWIEIDPCYVFHPVNAYETGRHIVIDVIRHERVFDSGPRHPGESVPTLWRWTVDVRGGMVTEWQLDGRAQEFPRIDDRYAGRRHRYTFATAMRREEGGAFAGPALLRHDLLTRRTDIHDFGPGREAGEAVFVPREPGAAEADGYLLTFVYDAAADRSDLVVVDTADFTGPPVAVVQLPVRVPHGAHAAWVTGD